jgi:hypothetical protein
LPWDKLPEDLRLSNYHQVAYAENLLATKDLGLRELKPDPFGALPPLLDMKQTIGKEAIDELAEMEHGRWNAERLLQGWRYAPQKDAIKKLSPYLVPWDELDKDIRLYDIDAIVRLPEKMRKANLEVYKK